MIGRRAQLRALAVLALLLAPGGFPHAAGDRSATLSWRNPDDADLAGVLVRFSTERAPSNPAGGEAVPNGEEGRFPGSPGDAVSFIHAGLSEGKTYHYSVFSFDEVPNYSEPAAASVTIEVRGAPDPPAGFRASRGDGEVHLQWRSPVSELASVHIRYSTVEFPGVPEEGAAVENGEGGVFRSPPGSSVSFVHGGLSNRVTYYYAAFVHDEWGSRSEAATARATPADTTAPGPVPLFAAAPGMSLIALSWTNPSDTDFAFTRVRYDTVAVPPLPSDGLTLPGVESGVFPGDPGSRGEWVHSGLSPGATYFYAAFAFDADSNSAEAAGASASPLEPVPALALQEFTATARENGIMLRWTNPADTLLAGTTIVFSPDSFPGGPEGGEPVPNGAGGFFAGFAGAVDSFAHRGLPNETVHHYTAIPSDRFSVSGAASRAAAVVLDTIPPPAPASFSAEPSEGGASLAWALPESPDLAGLVVRFSIEAAPSAPEEGEPLPNGAEGRFAAAPGGTGFFTHEHVSPGTEVHYSLFAFDEVPNYSEPATATVFVGESEGASPVPPDPFFLDLEANRPNPFNPRTTIRFEIRAPQRVRIEVFSAAGLRVATLIDEARAAGEHVVSWDGRGERGEAAPSGAYFLRITTENASLARKMLLVR
ncbi:MAG: FlgD immunoglobulin-like domain containing protein [Candidatus Eisenbacteria bacterium]